MKCPDENELVDLVEGRVHGARSQRLRLHFAECGACAELVSEFSEGEVHDSGFLAPDTRVDRYVITRLLGVGAIGAVYVARDPDLDREVAIKIVHADLGPRRLLRDEGRALAALRHRNVVAVFDIGVYDDRAYVVLEYVTGLNLQGWLEANDASASRVLSVFDEAAQGLQAVHDAGLVHGDFKPSNVLVGLDGRVLVSDFGLARLRPSEDPPPATPTVAGTVAFMAPECRAGEPPTAASDQYSYAVAVRDAIDGRGSLSPRQTSALRRALSDDPGRRYPSMHALRGAMRGSRRTRRALAAGVGAVVLAAALWPSASAHDSCETAHDLTLDWSDDRRAQARRGVLSSGAPFVEEGWSRIERHLDTYASNWATAQEAICRRAAGVGGEHHRCLKLTRAHFAAMLDQLDHADAATIHHAALAVYSLPPPERCLDNVSAVELATSPALDPVRERLATATVMAHTGHLEDAMVEMQAALSELPTDETSTLRLEAQLRLGDLEARTGAPAVAAERLSATYWAAISAREDGLAARAASLLILIYGRDLDEPRVAERWVEHARASVTRTDEHAGPFYQHAAQLAWAQGRPGEAVASMIAALASFEAEHGPDHPTVAAALQNLANVLTDLGGAAQAIDLLERALAIDEDVMGSAHPETAVIRISLGTALAESGRLDEGSAACAAALASLERTLGPNSREAATAVYCLAGIDVKRDHPAQARERYVDAHRRMTRAVGDDHSDTQTIAQLIEELDASASAP